MKIMMVCLGNICRSPMAQGILQHKIDQNGLHWQVDSCGTGAWHVGNAPDIRAQKMMAQHGIDISHQKARKFNPHFFEDYDLILAMDSANFNAIINQSLHPHEQQKVELIMNLVEPEKNIAIPDPYYDDPVFEKVYAMLNLACDALLIKYKQH